MPTNIRANIELGAQILIAVAVVVIAGVIAKRSFFPRHANPTAVPGITIGERLNVPNVDWAQNKKSLVFFLMKDCHYCATSAPLYRHLIAEASQRNVKSLAILPNAVEEGKKYVHSLDLPIESVQTGSLSSYKIPGTPSVLFVDDQGVVKSVWIGTVPGRENEMLDQLKTLFNAPVSGAVPAKREALLPPE